MVSSSIDQDQDDSSSVIVTTTHSAEITQVQLVTGVVLTVLAGIVIVFTLMEIQRHHNRFDFDSDPSAMDKNELELESNDGPSSVSSVESSPPLKHRLRWFQKTFILAQVGTLILLNYLLLVYLPASISLSVLAAFLIWCLTLHQVIVDECCRRSRYDRILVVLACFLLTAASLSLATFARLTQQEGTLYRGPARIIGYDTDKYSNKNNHSTIRTDLRVSFGGEWGCPENPTECIASVNGVLCQDKYQDPSTGSLQADEESGNNGRWRGRYLSGGNGTQDDLMAMNEELQNELDQEKDLNQDLEENLENEQENNEQLEEDLEEEEEGNGVYEVDDYYYGNWSFDDGYYDDGYWSVVDWDSVWGGEYACGDLFTSDIELMQPYDYTKMPGNDSWPYLTVYGSCNSCNAYLVDYFSTEHFASINNFLTHSRYYGAATAFVGLLALLAALKQRFNPSHEKEIELLSVHGRRSSSVTSDVKPGPPINTALFD